MIGREGPGPERPGPDYPPEWDTEPDPRDEHDAWHPVWVEGCDGCVDRADELEQQRLEVLQQGLDRVSSDAS